jgi:hypothetical protein
MNIQNNDKESGNCQYYVWHSITNKLNYGMILLCTQTP